MTPKQRREARRKPIGEGNLMKDARLIRRGDPRHRDYQRERENDASEERTKHAAGGSSSSM